MFIAGIDAHASYLVVAVVSNTGELVQRATRIKVREPEKLVELLSAYRPLEVVVETSPSWPWLHDLVVREGIGFVLAHAKRLRAIAESNYKSDKLDAELLARMRVAGLIPEVYPRAGAQREKALLARHRAWLVTERTRLLNRIHSQLHGVGMQIARGKLKTGAGRRWVREVAWSKLGPEQRCVIRTHWRMIDALTPLINGLDKRVRCARRQDMAIPVLRSIRGIGPYRALLIAAEILPISRFPQPKHLVAYAGLAPRSRQSGVGPVRYGSIPAGANRWLRGTLVRVVVSHVRHRPNSWLSRYYRAQKEKLGWQVARVATARKLCRAIHAMLRTGEVWNNEAQGSTGRGELRGTHVAVTT